MKLLRKIFGLNNTVQNEKLPEGWSQTKISENDYTMHIPQDQKDKWIEERHKRDNVNSLIKMDGFHLKPEGRSGTIYYVENGMLCEMDIEISGAKQFDILIYFDGLSEWILPKKQLLNQDEKTQILERLKLWLEKENIKAEI